MEETDGGSTTATRPCPFCAEDIKRAAVLCRYCGNHVDGPLPTSGPPGNPPPGNFLRYLPHTLGALGALAGFVVASGVVDAIIGGAVWVAIGGAIRAVVSRNNRHSRVVPTESPAPVAPQRSPLGDGTMVDASKDDVAAQPEDQSHASRSVEASVPGQHPRPSTVKTIAIIVLSVVLGVVLLGGGVWVAMLSSDKKGLSNKVEDIRGSLAEEQAERQVDIRRVIRLNAEVQGRNEAIAALHAQATTCRSIVIEMDADAYFVPTVATWDKCVNAGPVR